MRYIKYSTMLLTVIIIGILGVTLTLIHDWNTPVNPGYSNAYTLNNGFNTSSRKLDVLVNENTFTVLTSYNNKLYSSTYNKQYNEIDSSIYDHASEIQESWYGDQHAYFIDNKHVFKHSNGQTSLISEYEHLYEGTKLGYVYSNNNTYFFNDYTQVIILDFPNNTSKISISSNGEKTYFSVIHMDTSKTKWLLSIYELHDNDLILMDNSKLSTAGIYKAHQVSSGYFDNSIVTVSVIKDEKTGSNISTLTTVNIDTFEATTININFNIYDPTVKVIGDKLYFSDYESSGIEEIGTSSEFYDNIQSISLFNKTKEQYTKNLHILFDYEVFTFDNSFNIAYVASSDNTSLNLISNNDDIVSRSFMITPGQILHQILNALTIIALSFSMSLFPLLALLLPVLFTVLPIAMIKVNWIERYPEKLVVLSIIVYIIGKIFTMQNILNISSLTSHSFIPFHLSSTLSIVLTLVSITVYSILSLLVYRRQHSSTNPILQFLAFYFIDAIGFILLVLPYPYM